VVPSSELSGTDYWLLPPSWREIQAPSLYALLLALGTGVQVSCLRVSVRMGSGRKVFLMVLSSFPVETSPCKTDGKGS
jgi:hypothetical protein